MCKIRRSSPQVPEMGLIPRCRLGTYERPFTNTGMDYFGPMFVSVGCRRETRYGVLFTCLTTRAVHLELAGGLTTDSCIMSIRKLIGRCGCPREIHSDNGTNFRGAAKELRAAILTFDQTRIFKECVSRGIEWLFNPPMCPHMGGSWERLIRSVKKALEVTLREQCPKEETLYTLFVEAECLVNSRPLTNVSLDAADDSALTPNHFLIGSSDVTPAPGCFNWRIDTNLKSSWRTSQALADQFWQRWVREYLPSLTRRTKWNSRTEPVKVDDIAIIVDEGLPRGRWDRGRIVAIHPGPDGIIRVVDIKTQSGVYRRPVSRLCILDVEAEEKEKVAQST